jgi:hypothetical protein
MNKTSQNGSLYEVLFVKCYIIRNSDTSLAGLVQLKTGKDLYTELPQSI